MQNLYPYQTRVAALLRAGRSVILQAPTGAGKTRAALAPFLAGWHLAPEAFPRQCLYAVPLRTLANQFETEYGQLVTQQDTGHGAPITVAIQTGARPQDRRFDADLIFLTIDQLLSSFLTIPYSLSLRQANVNAGAVIGSYLVFDEFHLFPIDADGNGAMATTLFMLKLLKGVTPFVLMTATLSPALVARLAHELEAEPVLLTRAEVAALPSHQGKARRYRYLAQPLTSAAVVADVLGQQHQRTLVICNTVERAQAMAQALRADERLAEVGVALLHSRFYASDRDTKEQRIRQEFGEERALRTPQPLILVATQVVEVGLNITSDALHTELAPAAALVQRAGRCARFANERGTVLIYDVPPDEHDGSDNFAPYLEESSRAVCLRTKAECTVRLAGEGAILDYHDELAWVDAAHAAADALLLQQLEQNRHTLRAAVERVWTEHNLSAARELIRDVESRTILIHPNPRFETLPNPYRLESLGLSIKALLKWFKAVQSQALELELDWIAQLAVPDEAAEAGDTEDAEQGQRVETTWMPLRPAQDPAAVREATSDFAKRGFLVVLHPALVQYDTLLGFRPVPGPAPAPESPPTSKRRRDDADMQPIQRETYAEHIAGLYGVYTKRLHNHVAAVCRRLEAQHALAAGDLDRAIRLMFAVHDVGKLDAQWQEWAHAWQAQVSRIRKAPLQIPAEYMAAHTDYDRWATGEWRAQRKVQPKRPPHAAESARASRDLVQAVARGCDPLYMALMSAIICHHNANLRDNHGPFHPPAKAARAAFGEAMRVVGLYNDPVLITAKAKVAWEGFHAQADLSEDVIDIHNTAEVILYLVFVRVLRVADQDSQQRGPRR